MTDSAPNFTALEPTSPSLIDGLRAEDDSAWERFTRMWTPLIFGRCRRLGFASEASHDISQNVMLKVHLGLSGFQRDGKSLLLRKWVQTIVRNEIAEYCRSHADQGVGGSQFQAVLAQLPSEEEASSVDWFAPAQILARALDVVQQDVEEHNWQAFRLIYFEQLPPQEAAQKLGRSPDSVRQATRRIRKKLQDEVEAMLD